MEIEKSSIHALSNQKKVYLLKTSEIQSGELLKLMASSEIDERLVEHMSKQANDKSKFPQINKIFYNVFKNGENLALFSKFVAYNNNC